MSLTLTNIPRIMRSKGWNNGARLMEIWFSRPRAVAPAFGAPETATIRMDRWVLTFPRARTVYNQLVSDRIWGNPAAQNEIARMLRRQGIRSPQSFGNLTLPVVDLDRDYVNQRGVGMGVGALDAVGDFLRASDPLDDMNAALGRFVFRVVVAGTVDVAGRGLQVSIHQVGIYVRDSYDFNGDQSLGYWDDSDNSVSLTAFYSGTQVTNEDFRNWRDTHGRGGDFLVYSDVKLISLTRPDTFWIR